MPEPFLDVAADAVVAAGTQTAGTCQDWSRWGAGVALALTDVPDLARAWRFQQAAQAYAAIWNPVAQRVAEQVEALGDNVSSAGNVILVADGDSQVDLQPTALTVADQTSHLSRDINFA